MQPTIFDEESKGVCVWEREWGYMPEHDQINSNRSTARPKYMQKKRKSRTRWKWRWNFILNHKYCQDLFYRFRRIRISQTYVSVSRRRHHVFALKRQNERMIASSRGSIVKWKWMVQNSDASSCGARISNIVINIRLKRNLFFSLMSFAFCFKSQSIYEYMAETKNRGLCFSCRVEPRTTNNYLWHLTKKLWFHKTKFRNF